MMSRKHSNNSHKICVKCCKSLELNNYRYDKSCARYRTECKACEASYRRDRRILFSEQQKFVFKYLSSHPCYSCNERNPIVLDFHHTRNKSFDISTMIKDCCSLPLIQQEINKCIVLCANCHRKLHSREKKDYRFRLAYGNTNNYSVTTNATSGST